MNRIFKTVWNVARKALVVVNERTGICQSRRASMGAFESATCTAPQYNAKIRGNRFGIPSAVCMALAGVLVLWGGNAEAAKTFPTDCAAVGGTVKDGVCYIGDGTQEETVVEAVNDEWTLTEGDLVVSGARLYTASGGYKYNVNGIKYVAVDGGVGVISNEGEGTLTITGGDEGCNGTEGIGYNAYGSGSMGTISNTGPGTLMIMGGDQGSHDTEGIGYNAYGSGSMGTILNTGTGTLTISGGSGSDSYGIERNAYDGGTGVIINKEEGTLTITGGDYPGISANAAGSGSTGTISNTGTGTLTITGGDDIGIERNAYDGGTGVIINEGEGTLTITGGDEDSVGTVGIEYNAYGSGSVGTISNTGTGTLTITGGSGLGSYGIKRNAYDGGTGVIINKGEGTLSITSGDKSGIERNAVGSGSTGTISNTGPGTLTISGGSDPSRNGIQYNAYDGGTGVIINEGEGTLTITGGSGTFAHGIYYIAFGSGSTGTISNGVNGTLNIFGNAEKLNYGIECLAKDEATGRLENAGVMTLNKNAIQSLSLRGGYASVRNYATGTVYAEAEAIFEKTESTSSSDSQIGLLNPADGAEDNAKVDGFGTNGTMIAWDLKYDWANYSVWEDGGVLNITDVVEGSLAAQQIESAFTSLFGTGTTLNFLGEDDWASEGVSSSDSFTASVGNALIDRGYAGNIVTNFNLDNAAADGTAQALTIGVGEGEVIKDSLGFRRVEGVSSVTVNSGKYFALIGLPAGGELIEGGAPVTLDNGMLMLGVTPANSAREDSSTAGTLETVEMKNGSRIETENMWVRIDSVKGDGNVALTETGRLYVKDLNVEGDVDNDGLLSADSLTVTNGTLNTTNVLKSEGRISVTETGTLSADGILASDTLDVKGVLKLGQSVSVYTGEQALKLMRERHADVAAELDRLEGKAEVSTMSVLDRIVAQSMKKTEGTNAEQEGSGKDDESASPSVSTGAAPSVSRTAPVLPQDAQAFAAFDAVNRVVSSVEEGATPDGHGLWAKLLAGESEFGVRSGSKFEVDSDGAVIGAEARLHANWKIGAAFSYLDGEIDSSRSKSDWKSYGLTAYAHYRAGDFGLKGSAGWLRGTTESSEDFDADVWHGGIRSEYGFEKGPLTLTPFLGVRLMSGSFDGTDSKTVFNAPVGLKLSGNFSTGGWTIAPALEAAYVRSMGDTDSEDVRFLPENAFEGSLSVKAEKGAWTGELSYRGAVGSNDYEDRAFEVRIGMKF